MDTAQILEMSLIHFYLICRVLDQKWYRTDTRRPPRNKHTFWHGGELSRYLDQFTDLALFELLHHAECG